MVAKKPKVYNTSIRNLSYRLRRFKDDLPRLLEESIREHEEFIVYLVSRVQLEQLGINGKGVEIMSYAPYTQRTIKNKKKKGQPTDRVTLRDTGAFHDSMFLVIDSEGFYITSSDRKTEKLMEKYGDVIFRLDNYNFNYVLQTYIRPYLIKRAKQEIIGKQ